MKNNQLEKLSDYADYSKAKISIAEIDTKCYFSTENMLPNKGGVTEAAGLPTQDNVTKVLPENVLVSNIRPYFKKIYFANELAGASNDVLCFVAKNGCLPRYLYYLLSSDSFFDYMMAGAKGTKMPRGDKGQIMNFPVWVPAQNEQSRIVSVLSALDEKIENISKINHNLEEQAKAILDQNCLAHKTLKVGDIVSFANGFAFKSSTYIEKGKFKVVTIKNVQDGKIDTSSADCVHEIPAKMKAECILNIGDVLLSLTGNVGRTGIVCENNLLLNQRVAKIIPHQSVLNAVCYFIFRRPEMKAALETIARGTAQANLSPVETLDIEIPFDIPTLQDIALCMKSFFEQIISNEMEIQTLAQLRDTLLPKLMSGEIDVSEVEV